MSVTERRNSVYQHCVVWGTGDFAFRIAKHMREFFLLDFVCEYGAYDISELSQKCLATAIEYHKLATKSECNEILKTIASWEEKTLIISANNTFIFPAKFVSNENIVIINYHPAFLNVYKGRNSECWAIFNQDQYAGVTWHYVTEDIDAGAIIGEEKIALDDTMTSIKLMIWQRKLGVILFKRVIKEVFLVGESNKRSVNGGWELHLAREMPNGGVIDPGWNDSKKAAFIRAMDYGNLKVWG